MGVSEKIRGGIKNLLDNKVDLSSSASRKEQWNKYASQHSKDPSDPLDATKHRSIFLDQLKKELVAREIDPLTYGLKRNKIKEFAHAGKGINVKVSPDPKNKAMHQQGGTQEIKSNVIGTTNNPNPTEQAPVQYIKDASGNFVPVQQQQQPQINITKDVVKASFKTMFSLAHLKFEEWEKLSPEEADTLAEAWQPIFQEYLQYNYVKWGAPLMTLGALVMERVVKLRSNKKKEKEITPTPRQTQPRKETTEPPKEKNSDSDEMSWEDYQQQLKERKKH